MSLQRERGLASFIIVLGFAVQFLVQPPIDEYRNALLVVMYPTAQAEHVKAVEDRMKEVGLVPSVSVVSNEKGEKVKMISSPVPRKEWGKDLQHYAVAVQHLPRVANVVPGLNEQGIPLDRIQELNVQDVGIVVMAALIGGFRKSAANVLWLQADANWKEGRHYRTVPLARAVTTLDPHFVDAWTVTCWHLAYNMSVEAKDPDEAAELIRQGIEFAEKGLSWNATRYELWLEIGWTYYDKVQNYARAAEYLKKALEHPHPTFLERAIAHAYERIPDIESALFWYNVSLKKYGTEGDPISVGAITTISERYVRAWQAYKEGELDKALQYLQEDWQIGDPFDTIGMHFKARIFESKAINAAARGDVEEQTRWYRESFNTWLAAGKHNASDRLARRRVLTLARNFAWNSEVPTGWNDVGLPDSWADKLKPESLREREESQPPSSAEQGQVDKETGTSL